MHRGVPGRREEGAALDLAHTEDQFGQVVAGLREQDFESVQQFGIRELLVLTKGHGNRIRTGAGRRGQVDSLHAQYLTGNSGAHIRP